MAIPVTAVVPEPLKTLSDTVLPGVSLQPFAVITNVFNTPAAARDGDSVPVGPVTVKVVSAEAAPPPLHVASAKTLSLPVALAVKSVENVQVTPGATLPLNVLAFVLPGVASINPPQVFVALAGFAITREEGPNRLKPNPVSVVAPMFVNVPVTVVIPFLEIVAGETPAVTGPAACTIPAKTTPQATAP